MNKKAQFLSFLIVFLIVVLSVLTYTMYKHNKYFEKLTINAESAINFKIYGLAEKNKYYLEKAAELSKQKALENLEKNAGHLNGECKLSLQTNKILWNSCPALNLEKDFKDLFEKEFKEYIKNQNQQYEYYTIEYENSLNKDEIKNIKINNINLNDQLSIKLNKITYSLDFNQDQLLEQNPFAIKYTFDPSFSIKAPDFSLYKQICDKLVLCNLNSAISDSQIDNCISSLKTINDLKITKNSQIIDISNKQLDFSVDMKSELKCKQKLQNL